MNVKVIVINKGEEGESCEVYEHRGSDIRVEVTEQKEPDKGSLYLGTIGGVDDVI